MTDDRVLYIVDPRDLHGRNPHILSLRFARSPLVEYRMIRSALVTSLSAVFVLPLYACTHCPFLPFDDTMTATTTMGDLRFSSHKI